MRPLSLSCDVTVKKWRVLAAVVVTGILLVGLTQLLAAPSHQDNQPRQVVNAFGILPEDDEVTSSDQRRPSFQWETARRRFENTARELKCLLDAEMKKIMNAVPAGNEKFFKIFMEDMQGYQTALQRDLTTLRHVDSDEEWRTGESRRLGDLVQRRIESLQNPEDCSRAKLLVCDLKQDCGFTCKLHHVAYCLIFAYATRRTLVLDDTDLQAKRGWQTYFQPLSKTCTEATGPHIEYNGNNRFVAKTKSSRIIHLPILGDLRLRPNFLPLAIPEDLAPRLTSFHGNPPAWWIGQFVRYAARPNSELLSDMKTRTKEIGFQNPVVGLQIRRTDKVRESRIVPLLSEFMVHVDEYFRAKKVNGSQRRVYLATDDPTLLQEARQKYSDYTFMGDSSFSRDAAMETRNSEQAWRSDILDTLFLAHTDYLVCTFSSNIGRAAYELMQTFNSDASGNYRSLDDVYHFNAQSPHNLTALEEHKARNDNEVSFEAGDSLRLRGNFWENHRDPMRGRNFEGFTDGWNWRSGKSGMYPSCKVEDRVVAVKMPTYPEVKEREIVDADDDTLYFVKSRKQNKKQPKNKKTTTTTNKQTNERSNDQTKEESNERTIERIN